MVKITHEESTPEKTRRPLPYFSRNDNFAPFENPFFPMNRMVMRWFNLDLAEEMENNWQDFMEYMESMLHRTRTGLGYPSKMSCDLTDNGDKFTMTADLPGIGNDEVTLNVTDNSVEIKTEHKESKEEQDKQNIRKERSKKRFKRFVELPEEITSSQATAHMNNGILTVELPKKTPKSTQQEKSRQVKVE